jgi:hypothetical protein
MSYRKTHIFYFTYRLVVKKYLRPNNTIMFWYGVDHTFFFVIDHNSLIKSSPFFVNVYSVNIL